ncbi:MAG: hypothetical protein KDH48_00565, partial [Rhodoferax sp.]|nr:hypothetical protein [Rhodoferax sp.]
MNRKLIAGNWKM